MLKILLIVFLLLSLGSALIDKISIESDDRRAFLMTSFGFQAGGHLSIDLKSLTLWGSTNMDIPDNGKFRLAFVVERSLSDSGARLDDEVDSSKCFHESRKGLPDNIIIPLAFDSTWSDFHWEKQIEDSGYYHVYFSNCHDQTQVDLELTITQYNLSPSGVPVYLSAGEQSLPTWMYSICLLFVVECVIWIVWLWKKREEVRSLHILMAVVVVVKILSVLFTAMKYDYLNKYGVHGSIFIGYYIFTILKSFLRFAALTLIGTGWTLLKGALTERDKYIMLAVLVTQALVNTALVVTEETERSKRSWVTWRDLLHLIDMICCCLVLFPIVWSIKHLKEAAQNESREDGKASRSLSRLKRFRSFYLLLVCYVYFTRILVFLLSSTLPFELVWIGQVGNEIAALFFYGTTGYLFRPMSSNPYLALAQSDDDDEDDIEMSRAFKQSQSAKHQQQEEQRRLIKEQERERNREKELEKERAKQGIDEIKLDPL